MTNPPEQDQTQTAPPVCYRHPGRTTYVSCVRCGKPACPDCLRPAAVGHQCVECIRSGNRTVRLPAGRFGGTVSSQARVTQVLVGINLAMYLVLLAYPSLANDWYIAGNPVAAGQWYRLITSAFLPPTGFLGLLDIAFNMWALVIVGPAMERQLGGLRYLAVYLASAIGGSVSYIFLAQPNQGALGASGAIFGLFGAWFVISRRLGLDSRGVVFLIVINLALGFVGARFIGWQAHVGGLVTGAVLTAAYVYAPRQRRGAIQLAATVAVLALLALGVIIRDQQLVGAVLA
ncbi:MAG: rhomboid family intramembrane serine protease [Actinobacteria bacterium]|nr:rhomboid family intramembrane serine protease [Actinomycetota bacterium]